MMRRRRTDHSFSTDSDLVSLDCVVTHVVDNDRCVLRGRIDTDSWTRAFPAHQKSTPVGTYMR